MRGTYISATRAPIGAVQSMGGSSRDDREKSHNIVNFSGLNPSGDRVGDGRPQQSPGRAAGAGLPSSASSILTILREI